VHDERRSAGDRRHSFERGNDLGGAGCSRLREPIPDDDEDREQCAHGNECSRTRDADEGHLAIVVKVESRMGNGFVESVCRSRSAPGIR